MMVIFPIQVSEPYLAFADMITVYGSVVVGDIFKK
jgi:hypothetical protein